MALIDLDYCLGPTEFSCAAGESRVVEVDLPPIQLLLRRLVFLHPTGIDSPLDATVRRVMRQQRMLPGAAREATMNSFRVGVTELIMQPEATEATDLIVQPVTGLIMQPKDGSTGSTLSSGIPIEAFLGGVGSAVDSLLSGGYVAMPSQRLGFTFRNHAKSRGARIRFAVVVVPSAPAARPTEKKP